MRFIALFLVLFFGFAGGSFAQAENAPSRPIKLTDDGVEYDHYITASKNGVLLYKQYYKGKEKVETISYYDSGAIKEIAHNKDAYLHGPVKEFYENGNLKCKYNTDTSRRVGEWLEYYENGRLKIRANYKNGRRHGKYREYSKWGFVTKREEYDNGKRLPNWRERFIKNFKSDFYKGMTWEKL